MNGPERLATTVFARRTELGLTRDQVRERGGPSEPTLRSIESKGASSLSATTLSKLDVALEWEPGSAVRVLDGGDAASRVHDRAATFMQGPDEVLVSLPIISELIAASADFEKLAADHPEWDGLEGAVARLHKALHPLYGQYVTGLFEENRRAYGSLSPVFTVFSRLLDEPIDSEDPAAFEERLYRRWLAGRTDGVDEGTTIRFEKRLGRKRDDVERK